MPLVVFTAAIVALVLIGLAISARRRRPMTVGEALVSSAVGIGLALIFGLWIALRRGSDDALAYFAAYLTEESLSLDNMVVFMAIFARFGVPMDYRQRKSFTATRSSGGLKVASWSRRSSSPW
jgi:tellurite resistance protein TerC